MAIWAAREGAVRWARGVVIALCVGLAVLVHHETAALAASSAQSSVHAMAGMPFSSAAAMSMGSASAHGHMAMPGADGSAQGADDGACAAPGVQQHCAAASVGTVQFAVPPQGRAEQTPSGHEALAGRTPARAADRAPPDLSALSQLRI